MCVSTLAKYNSSLSIPLRASWMDERSRDDLLTTKTMKTRDNERQRGRDRKDHHVESTPSNWKSGFIGSWKGSRRRATRKSRCQLVADWSRGIRNQPVPDAQPFSTRGNLSLWRCCFRETISWAKLTRDAFNNRSGLLRNDKYR